MATSQYQAEILSPIGKCSLSQYIFSCAPILRLAFGGGIKSYYLVPGVIKNWFRWRKLSPFLNFIFTQPQIQGQIKITPYWNSHLNLFSLLIICSVAQRFYAVRNFSSLDCT
ncbi:MAG: hypothetical protein H7141_08400 [Burkholderiales bacterium]|nr:hypothetical protein [Bacteroidia bacterium]